MSHMPVHRYPLIFTKRTNAIVIALPDIHHSKVVGLKYFDSRLTKLTSSAQVGRRQLK